MSIEQHLGFVEKIDYTPVGPHSYMADLDATYKDTTIPRELVGMRKGAGLPVRQLSMQEKGSKKGRKIFGQPLQTEILASRGNRVYIVVSPFGQPMRTEDAEAVILAAYTDSEPHYEKLGLHRAPPRLLPYTMTPGTCGPFITEADEGYDRLWRPKRGKVGGILFDPQISGLVELVVPGRPEISLSAQFSDVRALIKSYFPRVLLQERSRYRNVSKAA